MNEKIIKPGFIKRLVDLLKCRNKKYTQEDVENIVSAFWDVIIDTLSNGDSINLNGYATIGTKHMAQRRSRNVAENKEMIVPEHYRVYFKAGSKLNQAATAFTQKQLGVKMNNELHEKDIIDKISEKVPEKD